MTKIKKLDAIPTQNGAITIDGLKATKTSVLKRELKALQSAIYKSDCYGVNDLQLASMIGRELEQRDTERKERYEKN